MKRYKLSLILVMSILILILVTGCETESKGTSLFDASEMQSLAQSAVQSMMAGDFEAVASTFDAAVAEQLDAVSLKAAWDGAVSILGAHLSSESITGQSDGDYYTATIVERYEENGLRVSLAYNKDKEIAGIYFDYAPAVAQITENEFLTEHEVTVVADTSMPLSAFLTMPKGVSNPPVVVLVQGTGATDKNETVYNNKPFLDIAHGLAKQGIATIRYDKRFFTYPDKAMELGSNLTLEDETLDDVNAILELLRKDDRINSAKIYILGHSLGGMLAPAIAAENPDIKGIISMAGTLYPFHEVAYHQSKAIEKTLLTSPDTDEATLALLASQMELIEKDVEIMRGDISQLPDDQLLMGFHVGYLKSAKEYAGINFIDDLTVPILVLQGDADFQVYVDIDFLFWQETLEDRDNVTLKLYEGLNHLMMETNGKSDASEYQVKGVVSQNVIDDIADFVSTT